MRYLFIVVLCLSNFHVTTLRAEQIEANPEPLVHAYFDAFKEGDMEKVAAIMHSDELSKFKDMMLPIIKKGINATDEDSEQEDVMAVKLFTQDASIETISEEGPREFFARFMNWIMILNPAMKDSLTGAKIKTVGHIPEDDLTHVVYRISFDVMGSSMSQMSVMSMKKQEGEWKLMLTGEIEGLSQMMQMNMEQLSE